MSAVKTILKAGVGAAAAVMGAGALVYECALNTKLNSFFVDLFDHRSDVKQETQSEDCACPREPGWFDRHKGDDHVIGGETFTQMGDPLPRLQLRSGVRRRLCGTLPSAGLSLHLSLAARLGQR